VPRERIDGGPVGLMSWYAYTPWIWPVLASVIFIGALSVYLWHRRDTPGALPLSLAAFLVALLCLVVGGEISTTDPTVLRLWFMVGDALMLPAAILALWFVLEYAGLRHLLTRVVVAFLLGSMIARAALLLLDGGLLMGGRDPLVGGLGTELGPLGAVFTVYAISLLLIATAVFVVLFIRSPAHRVPVALILLGQAGVRVAYILASTGSGEIHWALLGVLAFDVLAVMYVIALTRFRLFDLVPVARQTIVEQMPDAMLVLDHRGCMAEMNGAAERLLERRADEVRGDAADVVLGSFPELLDLVTSPVPASAEVAIETSAGPRSWQAGSTVLTDWRGAPIGRLVVLHDISELRRAEALLLQHERALIAVRERVHMARDLHDTIGQVLAYASMQADAARRLLAEGRAREADDRLARLADVAREAHGEVRGYILELNAGPSTRQPLGDTLRQYLDSFSAHYGIRTELRVDGRFAGDELAGDAQVQVFRIVQEALANARRHADARTVRVELDGGPSRIRVLVEDDGRGFEVGAVDGDGHFGLRFMRERAEELGARLAVLSRPGDGTRVVLDLAPLTGTPEPRIAGGTSR
jgi:PAS domain S-box-containing protein